MEPAAPARQSEISVAPITDTAGLGKAMLSLNPQQRAFVVAYATQGGSSAARAAAAAGYGNTAGSSKIQGYRLMHDDRVLAAIREEATKRISGSVLLGASVLVEIAKDPLHKDRLKAASALLDRGGMMLIAQSNINVNVTQHSQADVIEQIRLVAARLGLDPDALLTNRRGSGEKALLQAPTAAIDAEFEVVVDSGLAGLEDIL